MTSSRDARDLLTAEQLGVLRHQAQATTEFMERLGGQIVNNVLEVWSGVIPTEGYRTFNYSVAAGSVNVFYRAADPVATPDVFVTVATTGNNGSTPTGTGTQLVQTGLERTVALASREFTIFGTAGGYLSVQVFTASVRPSS
jgi:hypothetical protein